MPECLSVQIEKVHNALQGHLTDVDIYLNGSGKELGGYDLLVTYDQMALYATAPACISTGSAWVNSRRLARWCC